MTTLQEEVLAPLRPVPSRDHKPDCLGCDDCNPLYRWEYINAKLREGFEKAPLYRWEYINAKLREELLQAADVLKAARVERDAALARVAELEAENGQLRVRDSNLTFHDRNVMGVNQDLNARIASLTARLEAAEGAAARVITLYEDALSVIAHHPGGDEVSEWMKAKAREALAKKSAAEKSAAECGDIYAQIGGDADVPGRPQVQVAAPADSTSARRCFKCDGSGIVAGAGEYTSEPCPECLGEGAAWAKPLPDPLKSLPADELHKLMGDPEFTRGLEEVVKKAREQSQLQPRTQRQPFEHHCAGLTRAEVEEMIAKAMQAKESSAGLVNRLLAEVTGLTHEEFDDLAEGFRACKVDGIELRRAGSDPRPAKSLEDAEALAQREWDRRRATGEIVWGGGYSAGWREGFVAGWAHPREALDQAVALINEARGLVFDLQVRADGHSLGASRVNAHAEDWGRRAQGFDILHGPTKTPAASNPLRVGVAVLLWRNGKVLMQKRAGAHGAGTWSFPGGHLDEGESPVEAAVRELHEETGVVLTTAALSSLTFTSDVFEVEGKRYVTLYFRADCPPGAEFLIREPEKCADMRWVVPGEWPGELFLPVQNFMRSNLGRGPL